MELLQSLKFVKAKPMNDISEKEELLGNIKQAVEELKLIKGGKLKGILAKELIDEL